MEKSKLLWDILRTNINKTPIEPTQPACASCYIPCLADSKMAAYRSVIYSMTGNCHARLAVQCGRPDVLCQRNERVYWEVEANVYTCIQTDAYFHNCFVQVKYSRIGQNKES